MGLDPTKSVMRTNAWSLMDVFHGDRSNLVTRFGATYNNCLHLLLIIRNFISSGNVRYSKTLRRRRSGKGPLLLSTDDLLLPEILDNLNLLLCDKNGRANLGDWVLL